MQQIFVDFISRFLYGDDDVLHEYMVLTLGESRWVEAMDRLIDTGDSINESWLSCTSGSQKITTVTCYR